MLFLTSCGGGNYKQSIAEADTTATAFIPTDTIQTVEQVQKEQPILVENEKIVADTELFISPTTPTPIPSPVIKKSAQPIKLQLSTFKIGEINHIVKDTMEYGIADTVELTISYNCPKEIIVQNIGTFRGRGNNITTQPIKVTPIMKAKLIDPSGKNFLIIPITETEQIVEIVDSTYTLWQWRVTPINAGNTFLVLSADMVIDNHEKSIKIYEDRIYVHIDFWTKLWNSIKLNWTYITCVLGGIIAIFGWIFKDRIINFFKPKS
jgi:hypothetical protein